MKTPWTKDGAIYAGLRVEAEIDDTGSPYVHLLSGEGSIAMISPGHARDFARAIIAAADGAEEFAELQAKTLRQERGWKIAKQALRGEQR